jgi:hypothetical protein
MAMLVDQAPGPDGYSGLFLKKNVGPLFKKSFTALADFHDGKFDCKI